MGVPAEGAWGERGVALRKDDETASKQALKIVYRYIASDHARPGNSDKDKRQSIRVTKLENQGTKEQLDRNCSLALVCGCVFVNNSYAAFPFSLSHPPQNQKTDNRNKKNKQRTRNKTDTET